MLFSLYRVIESSRYCGVDCHDFLPRLHQQLSQESSKESQKTITFATLSPNRKFSINSALYSPPTIEAWVGRETELSRLLDTKYSVLVLHGMGGFGKSSLAARYFFQKEKNKDLSVLCWADCREQSNTIQTHMINMLNEITQGEITPESLQKATTQDVIDLFFERLGDHRALFVFDNIDHYVDLETQKATGTVHMVLEKALTADHKSQFIFTSRPKLEYFSSRFLALPVVGLNENEAEKLFELRGASWDLDRKGNQLKSVMRVTQGSALHLNLIATQIAKQRATLWHTLRIAAHQQNGKMFLLKKRAMLLKRHKES